ncbi:MAG: alpha/beta hydrolase [Stackebrandtia sp.]
MNRRDERLTIVAVHGAWRDGTAWNQVAGHLRRAGHEVHHPTTAGHGPGAQPGVTVAEAVDSIVEYVHRHRLHDVVLVGHSLGGLFVSQSAPLLSDRLKTVVFLAAFVPESGQSVYDTMPVAAQEYFRNATDEQGFITQDFDRVRNKYLSTLDHASAREAYRQMSLQPAVMFDTPVDQTGFDHLIAGGLSVSYIDLGGDLAMGPDGWYATFAHRLGPNPRVIRIPTEPHEITYTNPRAAACAIVAAARN